VFTDFVSETTYINVAERILHANTLSVLETYWQQNILSLLKDKLITLYFPGDVMTLLQSWSALPKNSQARKDFFESEPNLAQLK
jgi:hypothetical protein